MKAVYAGPLPYDYEGLQAWLIVVGVLVVCGSGLLERAGPHGNRWGWYAAVGGIVLGLLGGFRVIG